MLGVDSLSTIVLFKQLPFSLGFRRFSGKIRGEGTLEMCLAQVAGVGLGFRQIPSRGRLSQSFESSFRSFRDTKGPNKFVFEPRRLGNMRHTSKLPQFLPQLPAGCLSLPIGRVF